jgi:hypothetical protein
VEFALFNVKLESCLSCGLEDPSDMLLVGLEVVAVDKDVVDIGRAKLVEMFMKHVINKMLKCTGGVGQAERYNVVLKQTITSTKSCLLLIAVSNLYAVKRCNHV